MAYDARVYAILRMYTDQKKSWFWFAIPDIYDGCVQKYHSDIHHLKNWKPIFFQKLYESESNIVWNRNKFKCKKLCIFTILVWMARGYSNLRMEEYKEHVQLA